MNLEEMKARFTSGNSVPVERAYLTKDEFDRLLRVVEAAQTIEERFCPVRDDQIFSKRIALDKLFPALRDLEQS